jgi:hypothetical protein
MVGREADMDVEWRIDCAPKRREEERSREESLETTRKPDIPNEITASLGISLFFYFINRIYFFFHNLLRHHHQFMNPQLMIGADTCCRLLTK